jgi:hypothetical protein
MAGRPAGDHVGHGEGLARAGDAQQGLEHLAVVHALHQLVDRRGLVARRRIGLEQLERRIGKADELAGLWLFTAAVSRRWQQYLAWRMVMQSRPFGAG